jgi:hypothetical protein
MLSGIDQEKHRKTIPSRRCDRPDFYWIFKDMDFQQWYNGTGHQALWLSGRRECYIDHASSHIVDLAKSQAAGVQHSVLFFFCSTAAREDSIVKVFVHTLLQQIVHNLRPQNRKSFITKFIEILLQSILTRELPQDKDLWRFEYVHSQSPTIRKIINTASDSDYWDALSKVLPAENERELCLIVDGLHEIGHRQGFIKGLRTFVLNLQKKITRVRSLFTSRPQVGMKTEMERITCIEYDAERKGWFLQVFPSLTPTPAKNKRSMSRYFAFQQHTIRKDFERA